MNLARRSVRTKRNADVGSKALGNDSYYLIDAQKPRARKRDDSGKESERPWNANLLRRFYS